MASEGAISFEYLRNAPLPEVFAINKRVEYILEQRRREMSTK